MAGRAKERFGTSVAAGPDSVPPTLRGIVERAMQKSIYERTQTAAMLLAELTEVRLDLAILDREKIA